MQNKCLLDMSTFPAHCPKDAWETSYKDFGLQSDFP